MHKILNKKKEHTMLKRKETPTAVYVKNRVYTFDMTTTNLEILIRTVKKTVDRGLAAGGIISLSAMRMTAGLLSEIESLIKIQKTAALNLREFVESERGEKYYQGKTYKEQAGGEDE